MKLTLLVAVTALRLDSRVAAPLVRESGIPTAVDEAPIAVAALTRSEGSSTADANRVTPQLLRTLMTDSREQLQALHQQSLAARELEMQLEERHVLLDAAVEAASAKTEAAIQLLNHGEFDGATLAAAQNATGSLFSVQARVGALETRDLSDAETAMEVTARRAYFGSQRVSANLLRSLVNKASATEQQELEAAAAASAAATEDQVRAAEEQAAEAEKLVAAKAAAEAAAAAEKALKDAQAAHDLAAANAGHAADALATNNAAELDATNELAEAIRAAPPYGYSVFSTTEPAPNGTVTRAEPFDHHCEDNMELDALRRPPVLRPGTIVALHSNTFGCFIKMNGDGGLQGSDPMGLHAIPEGWTSERFHVVDAGDGEIALWNELHNRYISMRDDGQMGASAHKGKDELPPASEWAWERFRVVDAGDGELGLYSPHHKRYVRMRPSNEIMDGSDIKEEHEEMPSADQWAWERFRLIVLTQAQGAVVASGVAPGAVHRPITNGVERSHECSQRCDAHIGCHFFTYFHDEGCRIYSECSSPVQPEWLVNVKSTIFAREAPDVTKAVVVHQANVNDWGEATCNAGMHAISGGCDAHNSPHVMQANRPNDDGNGWMCGGHSGTKDVWVLCSTMPVHIVRSEGGDWHETQCPAGSKVISGGCDAKNSPHVMQHSAPAGDTLGAFKCGGHGGDKTTWAICAFDDGKYSMHASGGQDWVDVFCPEGQTMVGGGCNANDSPHRFQYNGPAVVDGATGWKCGGHGGSKQAWVVCHA